MTHGRFSVKFRTGTGRADASLDGNGGICYSLFCCFDERGKNMAVFLHALSAEKFVTENTLIIVETSLGTDFSYLPGIGLQLVREKDYKSNRHLFIRRRPAE